MSSLLRAFFYSSAGTFSTLIFGAVIIKILVLCNGPEGVGLFSILRQLQQTLVVIAMLGGQVAIVQGLASLEKQSRDNFLVATFKLTFLATVLVILLLIVFSSPLSQFIFGNKIENGSHLIYWSILPLFCSSIFTFLCSVLNGNRAIGMQSLMLLTGSFLGACLAYPLAKHYQLGSTVSYIILLTIPFAIGGIGSFLYAYKKGFLAPLYSKINFSISKTEAQYFLKFALVTLVTTFMQAGSLLVVRSMLLKDHSMAMVGIFDAAWTLSMTYVMLLLNSISMFYLPELSKITDSLKRQQLIDNVIRLAATVLLPLITFVLGFKYLYILVFYSKEFAESQNFIRWMILGDFFKVFGWIFAVSMLAYARMKPFFLSELMWHSSFMICSYFIIKHALPIESLGTLFFVLYFGYFIFCAVYIHHIWKFNFSKRYFQVMAISLGFLLSILFLFWNETGINWTLGLTSLLAAIVLSGFFWIYLKPQNKVAVETAVTDVPNILMIHHALVSGGIETLIVKLANKLHEKQFNITLITEPGGDESLRGNARNCTTMFEFKSLFLCFAFYSRLKNIKVDVIYCFGPLQLLIGLWLKQRLFKQAKLLIGVYHPREYYSSKAKKPYLQKIIEQIVKKIPDQNIVFMNQACKERHSEGLGRNFANSAVIPVPTGKFSLCNLSNSNSRKIISIGRLVSFKRYNFAMIQVIESLKAKGLCFEYHIYGDGEDYSDLSQAAQSSQAAELIFLHGTLNYAELPVILKDSFLFVGMGMAMVEAAAMGIPALVAIESEMKPLTYGFFGELDPSNTGETSNILPRHGLLEKIEFLSTATETQYVDLVETGRLNAASFDIDAIIGKYIEFYQQGIEFQPPAMHWVLLKMVVANCCRIVKKRLGFSDPLANRYLDATQ